MSHKVVRITEGEWDDFRDTESRKLWHLVVIHDGSERTFCGGEAFGPGESGVVYKEKSVKKNGVTCPRCLRFIKEIKELEI